MSRVRPQRDQERTLDVAFVGESAGCARRTRGFAGKPLIIARASNGPPAGWESGGRACAASLDRGFGLADDAATLNAALHLAGAQDALDTGFAVRRRLGLAALDGVAGQVGARRIGQLAAPRFVVRRARFPQAGFARLPRLTAQAPGPLLVVRGLRRRG